MASLVLNGQKFDIPFQFKKMGDISSDIFNELINSRSYQVKSSVSPEVFQEFVKYLIDGSDPEVQIDNFYELLQLSNEFHADQLKNLINAKKAQWKEYEKSFVQHQQAITQLYQLVQKFSEDIKLLQDQLQRVQIDVSAKNSELNQEFLNKIEEMANQQSQYFEERINNSNNHISEQIQLINGQFESLNSKFSSQNDNNENTFTSIEKLNVQIESLQRKISMQDEKAGEFQSEVDSKLAQIGLMYTDFNNKIEEQKNEMTKIGEAQQAFITKDVISKKTKIFI